MGFCECGNIPSGSIINGRDLPEVTGKKVQLKFGIS